MPIILAATHHDADGRLYEQTARILPRLCERYSALVVTVTPQTQLGSVAVLRDGGALVCQGAAALPTGHLHLGLWRRLALANALERCSQARYFHFCDLDRALHWAEFYPEELQQALAVLQQYDFTVFGRTPRAFTSHPRAQWQTEAIANEVFALVFGEPWDVMAAARGMQRRAAELIVRECRDDTVGSDCSWPLLAQRAGLCLGYLASEGLEFETLDRYGDEVAALGGAQAWCDRFDADPQQWAMRLELARAEVLSAVGSEKVEG